MSLTPPSPQNHHHSLATHSPLTLRPSPPPSQDPPFLLTDYALSRLHPHSYPPLTHNTPHATPISVPHLHLPEGAPLKTSFPRPSQKHAYPVIHPSSPFLIVHHVPSANSILVRELSRPVARLLLDNRPIHDLSQPPAPVHTPLHPDDFPSHLSFSLNGENLLVHSSSALSAFKYCPRLYRRRLRLRRLARIAFPREGRREHDCIGKAEVVGHASSDTLVAAHACIEAYDGAHVLSLAMATAPLTPPIDLEATPQPLVGISAFTAREIDMHQDPVAVADPSPLLFADVAPAPCYAAAHVARLYNVQEYEARPFLESPLVRLGAEGGRVLLSAGVVADEPVLHAPGEGGSLIFAPERRAASNDGRTLLSAALGGHGGAVVYVVLDKSRGEKGDISRVGSPSSSNRASVRVCVGDALTENDVAQEHVAASTNLLEGEAVLGVLRAQNGRLVIVVLGAYCENGERAISGWLLADAGACVGIRVECERDLVVGNSIAEFAISDDGQLVCFGRSGAEILVLYTAIGKIVGRFDAGEAGEDERVSFVGGRDVGYAVAHTTVRADRYHVTVYK